MHQQKHRRRIGRRHHGADQQRLGPVQIERIFGDRRGDQRRQQHADGRQHHRGRQHRADALKPRAQAAVEQDQRQRHRSHQIGGAHVVEPQLARAGIAGHHADQQKHQQQRRAEAQRQQARQDAGHHQNRAEKNGYADRIERSHERFRKSPQIPAIASLSSPQFDAKAISGRLQAAPNARRIVPAPGNLRYAGVSSRWRRRGGYGNSAAPSNQVCPTPICLADEILTMDLN